MPDVQNDGGSEEEKIARTLQARRKRRRMSFQGGANPIIHATGPTEFAVLFGQRSRE